MAATALLKIKLSTAWQALSYAHSINSVSASKLALLQGAGAVIAGWSGRLKAAKATVEGGLVHESPSGALANSAKPLLQICFGLILEIELSCKF